MHTLTADNQKRVRIPDAKPGQVFAYEIGASGRFILTIVEPKTVAPAKFKVKKNKLGFKVIETDRVVNPEKICELLVEMTWNICWT